MLTAAIHESLVSFNAHKVALISTVAGIKLVSGMNVGLLIDFFYKKDGLAVSGWKFLKKRAKCGCSVKVNREFCSVGAEAVSVEEY